MSASQIFDSLPYFDRELEEFPILKEKADHELAKEGPHPQAPHPSLRPELVLFAKSPMLEAEMKRVESGETLSTLDGIRFQLPGPTSTNPTDEDWRKSLDNAHVQMEHQRIRHTNLALLQQYGANAWRVHNYRMESEAKHAEKDLETIQQRSTDVNRERKNFQERVGSEIASLEKRWAELISTTLQVEMANMALVGEIDRLNAKEAELAGV